MDTATRGGLAELRRSRNARMRAERATALLEQLGREIDELSRIREAAVLELHEAGLSYAEIARVAHVSRSRVAQIVHRSSRVAQ